MKSVSIFEEKTGVYSMRRVCSFMLFIFAFCVSVLGLIFGRGEKAIICVSGLFLGAGVLLLLFTTWQDLKEIIKVVKD